MINIWIRSSLSGPPLKGLATIIIYILKLEIRKMMMPMVTDGMIEKRRDKTCV